MEMSMETKKALVEVYVDDAVDLGLSFDEAVKLALERDADAAKDFRVAVGGEDA